MKTQSWMLFGIIALVFSVQIIIFQFMIISRLKDEIRIAEKAKDIETDQSQDLMYQLSQMKAEMEASGTRQFVTGVVSAIAKPDLYTEIWHNGYDRGVATTQYANNLDLEESVQTIQTSVKN